MLSNFGITEQEQMVCSHRGDLRRRMKLSCGSLIQQNWISVNLSHSLRVTALNQEVSEIATARLHQKHSGIQSPEVSMDTFCFKKPWHSAEDFLVIS